MVEPGNTALPGEVGNRFHMLIVIGSPAGGGGWFPSLVTAIRHDGLFIPVDDQDWNLFAQYTSIRHSAETRLSCEVTEQDHTQLLLRTTQMVADVGRFILVMGM